MMMGENGPRADSITFDIFTLYENATDYRDKWVIRKFRIWRGRAYTEQVAEGIFDNRADADKHMATHYAELAFMARNNDDAPQIVGVWL